MFSKFVFLVTVTVRPRIRDILPKLVLSPLIIDSQRFDPQTSGTQIIWYLLTMQVLQPLSRSTESETLGLELTILTLGVGLMH